MTTSRLERARGRLAAGKAGALIVTGRDNVRWLSGFSGSSGALLLTPHELHLFTDSRYGIQGASEAPGAILHISNDPVAKQAADAVRELGCQPVAFEPDELTYQGYWLVRNQLKGARLVQAKGWIGALRYIKDSGEISLMQRAAAITDDAFREVLVQIRLGVTELDVARELVYTLSRCGAQGESFPCIVAAGEHAALPHASPGARVLAAGEPVLLDFGAVHAGYAGDITRTVFLGPATQQFRKVYQIVLDAQEAAIAAIRPGVAGKDVDTVARDIITAAGYGESFGHGLGHSLGLNVHDGPGLSQRSTIVLEEGMVVTVEPGIYIEGWGAVRIEDDVLVTSSGAELLTHSPKGLMELPA